MTKSKQSGSNNVTASTATVVTAKPVDPQCTNKSNNETHDSSNSTNTNTSTFEIICSLIYYALLTNILVYIIHLAYRIRLIALKEYGNVIHEFDPYFNYRATEYLYAHGWHKFRNWFDYKVWYPLGRPVGTTIYPGMQVTAVFIKNYILKGWSINDICCFIPPWFGSIASFMTGMLALECSRCSGGSVIQCIPMIGPYLNGFIIKFQKQVTGTKPPPIYEIMVCTAAVMSILPAHLMRSVGGGYDNESVAMAAMTTTFYFWVKSLQCESTSIIYGLATGVAYFYMVACWGGYVFVLNLIGAHAGILFLLGRYNWKLYKAYTTFYLLGTFLAMQVPVVGLTPLKSLEQMGPCLLFLGMQLLAFCDIIRQKRNLTRYQEWQLRIVVFIAAAFIAAIASQLFLPTGYFGPISSRVRGLFVKHTRTGNPLVDSVAEHQPADTSAYWRYLYYSMYIAPVGFGLILIMYFDDSSSFLIVYAMTAYFFSHKMVRLILLTAPICAVLSGVVLGRLVEFVWTAFIPFTPSLSHLFNEESSSSSSHPNTSNSTTLNQFSDATVVATAAVTSSSSKSTTTVLPAVPVSKEAPKNRVKAKATPVVTAASTTLQNQDSSNYKKSKLSSFFFIVAKLAQVLLSISIVYKSKSYIEDYHTYSWEIGKQMSHPTILFKAQTNDGQTIIVDDYREAYLWLKTNTPEDARVMAWWDYGYQITGIGDRTTLADGNTWNHEHIALLGRILTGPEKESHRIARHLADYVLIWAGGGGDDLAKSPHLARIANSVYRGLCPDGPTCRSFGFYSEGKPSPMMERSLLYKLHQNGINPAVEVDRNRFRQVYISKHQKVKIYKILSVSKESKQWVVDNRACDVPGSWFCPGQYPPALQKVLNEKKDFRQLEDFNKQEGHDDEYNKQYMDHLSDPNKARTSKVKQHRRRETKFEDTDETTRLYSLIASQSTAELKEYLETERKYLPFLRSKDGRGPMFWAYEFGHKDIIKLLKSMGVSDTQKDTNGIIARDVLKKK